MNLQSFAKIMQNCMVVAPSTMYSRKNIFAKFFRFIQKAEFSKNDSGGTGLKFS